MESLFAHSPVSSLWKMENKNKKTQLHTEINYYWPLDFVLALNATPGDPPEKTGVTPRGSKFIVQHISADI